MIKINQIKLPVTHSDEALKKKIIKMLKLNAKTGFTYRILKKSLDARKKPELFYTYSVAVEIADTKNSEEAIVKRAASSSVLIYKEKEYRIPAHGNITLDRRPVIAGAGPAGLFCAYILAEAGFRPIVIERGSRVEKRTCDVQKFWESGILNPKSNVQFGEGGAGTFSDGKLNTSVKDPSGRNRLVLETFVRFGADPSILYAIDCRRCNASCIACALSARVYTRDVALKGFISFYAKRRRCACLHTGQNCIFSVKAMYQMTKMLHSKLERLLHVSVHQSIQLCKDGVSLCTGAKITVCFC